MVRTEENIVQKHAFFSKKCFHLLMDIFHIFDPTETSRNNRLVRDHDPEFSGLVDLPDRIDRTVFQNEVILFVY